MSNRLKTGKKVSFISLFTNIFLTIIKITVGLYFNSKALIADGVHSLSDIASTIIILISIKFSHIEADEKHPYGHGKAEAIGTAILGIILIITSLFLIKETLMNIFPGNAIIPGDLALWVAFLSIITKEGLYQYTIKIGKKINSKGLIADAHHHRSDALSSIAALIGILGSKLGLPILDPIAGFVVSIFIGKVGIEVFMEAVNELLDGIPSNEKLKTIKTQVKQIPEVIDINNIKIRTYGPSLYIDLAIVVENNLNIKEAHEVSVKVQEHIKNLNKDVKEVFIHIDPA